MTSAGLLDGAVDDPWGCAGNCRTAEPLGAADPPLKPLRDPLPLAMPLEPLLAAVFATLNLALAFMSSFALVK